MPRYTLDGKRIVNRPPRFEVPGSLLADIDAGAAKVLKLRGEVDDLKAHIRKLEHGAYRAGVAADTARAAGLRKVLYDRADILSRQASDARGRLGHAERSLGEHELALGRLHQEARAWQRGDYEED